MTQPLSPRTIAIVKSTAPVMQVHGVAITTRMYERLFDAHPDIETLFDRAAMTSGAQPRRLAGAILAFAQNADNLGVLGGAIEGIASRHVRTHIRPEHYPAVAEALLPAIRDVLGDAADDDVLAAWGEAYWFLADVLKGREAELYAAQAA